MRSVVSLWILLLLGTPMVRGQVRAWEGTMPLAASDEGAPDENPNFDEFAEVEDYPYTMRQTIFPTESMHNWRAVYLENEYLKCTILPDVGGHLYTCIDKINGTPMFYANPSLKKALVAYRGAWAAFGVEFNFPVSHNWVTISPVDFAYGQAADGSSWVTVGNRDRVYGMDWTVQMVLRPGSTVLEEHVTLSNPTDLRHHYFWWNNGAVQVWNDSRIWYPMKYTTDGDSWPVDSKGVDQSLISNETAGQVSRFAYGSRERFMGVYNPHTNAGVVHYAELDQVPAKKIWSWGVDKPDLDWRNILSDNNSAYVELQGGLFKDQETYGYLDPLQAVRFSEFWMPVRGIGSISRANLDGVVAIAREKQADGKIALKVGFNANHALGESKIEISDGAANVFEESASLDPATTWTHRIADLPADKKYTFTLTSAKGDTLLKHTEDDYDLIPPEPAKGAATAAPTVVAPSAGDFLDDGANHEMAGDYGSAWERYTAGLAKYPSSVELLKAAGRLAVSQFRFEEAAKDLGQAEEGAGTDAEVHYYRGVAETALGHPADARRELEAARNSAKFRAAAGVLLAEMLARDHDSAGAVKELEGSCPASGGNLRCLEETVALERGAGDTEHARSLARATLAKYPTSLFLRNEAAKMGLPSPETERRLAADSSKILNLVQQYDRLGMYADSLELLTRSYPSVPVDESDAGAVPPASDPELAYYRGFCREKMGKSGQADYDAASKMPLLYVFPNSADTFPVLRAALTSNPADASAHFLLGALLFSKGIVDPALEEWKAAESLNPKIPSLQASVGRVLFEIKKQPVEAVAELQRGLELDHANPALYLEMNEAMKQTGKSASQRADMMRNYPSSVMSVEFFRAFADDLREAGRKDEVNELLSGHFVPRKEGVAPLQPTNQAK